MLIVKSLHIVFMVTWFAGLFYLPRLFVYHALTNDQEGLDRFKIMERKLFFGIMTPGAMHWWMICGRRPPEFRATRYLPCFSEVERPA